MAIPSPGNREPREAPLCYDLAEEQGNHRIEHEVMAQSRAMDVAGGIFAGGHQVVLMGGG